MVAEETIMIAIDNSGWMLCLDPYSYGLQLDAIRSYCRAKLKLNPKNAIGIVTMGKSADSLLPTSDLDKILAEFQYGLILGGELDFIRGINTSRTSLRVDIPSSKRKRILFFTGGPTNLDIQLAERYGKSLKQQGVAADVINFCLKEHHNYWKRALDAFVAAVNNNNNSCIKHIQADSCTTICDVLSSTPAFIPRALLEEGDHIARNKKAKDLKGKNQPATLEEYVEARLKELGKHKPMELRKQKPMELQKHKPMELRNKFKALSLDNNGENV